MARKKQKRQKKQENNFIAKALIALGILLLFLGLATHTEIYYRYLLTQQEKPVTHVFASTPRQIAVPAVGIDVKVDQGGIVAGNWVLSSSDALYLPTSGMLGEGYNTIIYAHNTNNLFGPLLWVKNGDLIKVTDGRGKIYTFSIFSKEDVNPHDLSKLRSTEKNILTLFTCDGWADQTRLLVKAKLIH